MKFEFLGSKEISLDDVNYGDILITRSEVPYLIVSDLEGYGYMGVNLIDNTSTDYYTTIIALVDFDLGESIVRVIKADEIVMGVK